jgi:hypothetical protein
MPDIVSEYSFGRSYHRLEQADFDPVYAQSMHEGASQAGFNRQILWPFTLLMSLPPWLVTKLVPDLSLYLDFIRDCETHVKAVKSGARGYEKDEEHPTIFHELLEGNLPPAEKSVARLVQEAQIVVSAGTETTARCLSVITYHLLANPEIVRILRKELEDAIPRLDEVIPLAALEQLPYLTACIQEGLRLSYGVSSRLQRISPDKVMLFNDGKKNWEIPAGVSTQPSSTLRLFRSSFQTPTSMTAYLVHHDESIFPASHEFQPQRWLDNPRLVSFPSRTTYLKPLQGIV